MIFYHCMETLIQENLRLSLKTRHHFGGFCWGFDIGDKGKREKHFKKMIEKKITFIIHQDPNLKILFNGI